MLKQYKCFSFYNFTKRIYLDLPNPDPNPRPMAEGGGGMGGRGG